MTTLEKSRSGVRAGKQLTPPRATIGISRVTADYPIVAELYAQLQAAEQRANRHLIEVIVLRNRADHTRRRLRAAESYADWCFVTIAVLLVLLIVSAATNFWAASSLTSVAQGVPL